VQKQVEDRKLTEDQWPKFLRERPSLLPGLEFYYEAFMDLSTCRSFGMGIGPIPMVAIWTYCDMLDLDDVTRGLMVDHVRAMDSAFLRYHREKVKAETKR